MQPAFDDDSPATRTWPFAALAFLVGAVALVTIILIAANKAQQHQAEVEGKRQRLAESRRLALPTRPAATRPRPEGDNGEQPAGKREDIPDDTPKLIFPKMTFPKVRHDPEDLMPAIPDAKPPVWEKGPPDIADLKPVKAVPDKDMLRLLAELGSGGTDVMMKAAEEIAKRGESAGPAAARALCYYKVSSFNRALRNACDRAFLRVSPDLYRLVANVLDKDAEVRYRGVEEIIRHGERAAPAVPALAECVRVEMTGHSLDPYLAPRCFQAMVLCGPDDLITARTALWLARSRSRVMRQLAFTAMGELSHGRPHWHKDFRQALERGCGDTSKEARDAAFISLEALPK